MKWVTRSVGKETVEREDKQSQKVRGKTEKDLKTVPVFAKHVFFATEVSRQQDARSSRQNTQRQNFEKFSKCFLRLESLPAKISM